MAACRPADQTNVSLPSTSWRLVGGALLTLLPASTIAGRALAQTPGSGATADEKGLSVRSADGAFSFRLKGVMQVDGRWFLADRALDDRDTFLIRRARPIVEATVLDLVDVRLMPDFGDGRTQLFDAYIDVRPRPWLRVRLGKFKPPIGLERLQSDPESRCSSGR